MGVALSRNVGMALVFVTIVTSLLQFSAAVACSTVSSELPDDDAGKSYTMNIAKVRASCTLAWFASSGFVFASIVLCRYLFVKGKSTPMPDLDLRFRDLESRHSEASPQPDAEPVYHDTTFNTYTGRVAGKDNFSDIDTSNPLHTGVQAEETPEDPGQLGRPGYATPGTEEWIACHIPPMKLVGKRILIDYGLKTRAATVKAFKKVGLRDAMKGKNSMVIRDRLHLVRRN